MYDVMSMCLVVFPPYLHALLLQLLKEGGVLYLLLLLTSHVVDVSLAKEEREKRELSVNH